MTASQVPDVPEIQLDDFAREYEKLINSGKHGPLLVKCMSDYNYNVKATNVCFNLGGKGKILEKKILDKDGNEIILTDSQGSTITYDNMRGLGYSNGDVTFEHIQNNTDFGSYTFNPNDFINDWKDLRTSLGDIPFDANDGTIDMSGLTSARLDKFHTEFDQTIRDKHKSILKKRNNLDNKMREMYGEKGDPDFNLDASVYSTMLFTIMTTSLLYYLFIKM